MSIEDTTNIDVTTPDNLDDFAAEFFGENKQPSDNAKSEDPTEVETEEENDAPNNTEDTQSAEDGATEEAEEENDASEEEETTDDNKEKPKKANRYQERINEVVAKQRAAERERDELARKLEELTRKPADPQPKGEPEQNTTKAPSPVDKKEDGSDKYPLGEFDPQFVLDTIDYRLNQERQEREAAEAQKAAVNKEQQYRNELQETWNTKLVDAQERYPDFREKGEQMLSVFEGIDDAYGQYLTDTLMEMDAGPEVFYYLANNLDEATKIVNAGPRKATIALAKLEAQLAGTPAPKKTVKVTNAPTPPPQLKGSAVAKAAVPLDTDDLDAFSKVLFSKK